MSLPTALAFWLHLPSSCIMVQKITAVRVCVPSLEPASHGRVVLTRLGLPTHTTCMAHLVSQNPELSDLGAGGLRVHCDFIHGLCGAEERQEWQHKAVTVEGT